MDREQFYIQIKSLRLNGGITKAQEKAILRAHRRMVLAEFQEWDKKMGILKKGIENDNERLH